MHLLAAEHQSEQGSPCKSVGSGALSDESVDTIRQLKSENHYSAMDYTPTDSKAENGPTRLRNGSGRNAAFSEVPPPLSPQERKTPPVLVPEPQLDPLKNPETHSNSEEAACDQNASEVESSTDLPQLEETEVSGDHPKADVAPPTEEQEPVPHTSQPPEKIASPLVSTEEKTSSNPVDENQPKSQDVKQETLKRKFDLTRRESPKPLSKKRKPDDDDEIAVISEVPKEPTSKSAPITLTGETLREKFNDFIKKNRARLDQTNFTDCLTLFLQQASAYSPLAVKQILEDRDFQTPVSLSFPPSTVVRLLAEYPPEKPIKEYGEGLGLEGPDPSNLERRHKQEFRLQYPAPNFMRTLYDLGLQLAQEKTYSDIVSMKNLPAEMPQKPETVQKVVSQIKPFLESLKKETVHLHLPILKCRRCRFQTESEMVMEQHRQYPHEEMGKLYCGYCTYFSLDKDLMSDHYIKEHQTQAKFEDPLSKAPCPICPEEFKFKGDLVLHLRECKRAFRQQNIFRPGKEDQTLVSKWLWEKPANSLHPSGVSTGVSVQSATAQNSQGGTTVRMVNGQPPGSHGYNQYMKNGSVSSANRKPQNILPRNGGGSINLATYGSNSPGGPGPNLVPNPRYQQRGPGARGLINSPQMVSSAAALASDLQCEICDAGQTNRIDYFNHLQKYHKKLLNKRPQDMLSGAPLACSRCKDRFWTYEGLERHLVMTHGLVTSDLLAKAQSKTDSGRCTYCNKQYAFNLLQHLVVDHKKKLCSAEILYSCDVCTYSCTSYQALESHLTSKHNAPSGSTPGISSGQKRPGSYNPQQAAKQMRFAAGGGSPYVGSTLAAKNQLAAAQQRLNQGLPSPGMANQKKVTKLRYTCTPCSMKFSQYSEVIAHWQDRHLKKIKVLSGCRIDKCTDCQHDFEKELKCDWELPDYSNVPKPEILNVSTEDETPTTGVICLD